MVKTANPSSMYPSRQRTSLRLLFVFFFLMPAAPTCGWTAAVSKSPLSFLGRIVEKIQKKIWKKSPRTLCEASLSTQELPSKRVITPTTSALHGAALAWCGWTTLMVSEAYCKNVRDNGNERNRLLLTHRALGISTVLGSFAGFLAGRISQRGGAQRWYGLPLRNFLSAVGAFVSVGGSHYFLVQRFFQECEGTTYGWEKNPYLHLGLALGGFLLLTELIRWVRARWFKTFSNRETKMGTLGRLLLLGSGVGLLGFILGRISRKIQPNLPLLLISFPALGVIAYILLAFLAHWSVERFCQGSKYHRYYKKIIMHALTLMMAAYFIDKKMPVIARVFPPLCCGLLYDVIITEWARAYYIRLLVQRGL